MPNIPDIAAFPLMRFGLRHAVIERGGMLWLDLAAEGGVSMLPAGARMAGLFEVSLISDGEAISYTYGSDGFTATLTCAKGTVKITHDESINALRIKASGVSLRLDAKSDMGVTSLNMDGGALVGIGGGKYFFKATKGELSFDDAWIRNAFHSVQPIVDVASDGGELELIAYDLPDDTEAPVPALDFDSCSAKNKADFEAFLDTLTTVPAKYAQLREQLGMLIWKNLKTLPNGHRCVASDRHNSTNVLAWHQAVASLAQRKADNAIDLLLALPESSPPLYGLAVSRLLNDGLPENTCEKSLRDLYFELLRSEKWWRENRSANVFGSLFFYAYRHESAQTENPAMDIDGPVRSPDLNAYLMLLYDALANLAERFGDDAKEYAENAKNLIMESNALWQNEKYVARTLYTNEQRDPGLAISLLMAVGAKFMLSHVSFSAKAQTDSIAKAAAEGVPHGVFGALIILGLCDAGYTAEAKTLAAAELAHAEAEGTTCPIYASALIALAARCL